MDETYRTVNAVIDDLRRVAAPSIPKLKVEVQLIKIKHMLLIIEAEQGKALGVKTALRLHIKPIQGIMNGSYLLSLK